MATSETKQEQRLDTFRQDLVQYETLILKKASIQSLMEDVDRELEDHRRKMLSGRSKEKVRPPTAPTRRVPRRSPPKKRPQGMPEVLKKADPRIQRSLSAVLAALKGAGGTLHLDAIAKALGISRVAAGLRVARAVKMGLLTRVSSGTYGVRT